MTTKVEEIIEQIESLDPETKEKLLENLARTYCFVCGVEKKKNKGWIQKRPECSRKKR